MAFTKKPGGWFRAGDPEIDPFFLGKGLDDLENRLDDALEDIEVGDGGGGFTANVRDFGAEGDGLTDDTEAIEGAIAEVVDAGGGTVFFPGGTYLTDTQIIYANMVFQGEGYAGTTLKLLDGADADLVKSEGFDANYAAGGSTLGPYGFGLKDITLDGNYAGQVTGGYCYRVYGYGHRVQGVRFINGVAGGVFSSWGTSGIQTNMEAHWDDFTISQCDGTGLNWNGPHDSVFSNAEIWTLASGRTMDYSILVTGNSAGEKFSNVHTWGKQTVGWRLNKRISAVNCTAEGASDTNLWFFAHQSYWHGDVYGTNANGSNNANECGIRFGDVNEDNGTADCFVWANIFNFVAPCFPVDYAHSFGNRLEGVCRITSPSHPTKLWKGTPVSEYANVSAGANSSTMELKLDPRPIFVPKTTVTTKGDMIVATAASTIARLGIGADGTVPTADASQTTGIRWALPNGATVTLGLNEIGASINALTNGSKYGSRFQVPGSLSIRTVQVPFDGLGAGSGTQKVRVVIHSDNAGAPNTLLSTSDEVTITAGEAMAWRTFTLPADLDLSTGYVYLGFHGGATGGVARYSYTQGAGGAYVYATDAYSGGADASFGAYTSVGNQLLNIRATSLSDSGTPGSVSGQDDGASQGDFDTLNAGAGITLSVAGDTAELAVPAVATLTSDVTDLDDRVSDLEVGGGGGSGGGIVTALETDVPLDIAEVYTGTPIDTGGGGAGVMVFASSVADATGTLRIQDSDDGSSWTYIASPASAGALQNIFTASVRRYVRAHYTNSTVAQTSFRLITGYSITP